MTEVRATLHVRCTPDVAYEQLRAMLLESGHADSTQPLLLTAKVPWTGIELSKEVRVEYSVPTGPSSNDETIGIRWTPAPGGVYPSFDGALHVLAGAHAYSSLLELVGHYTPPLGALGKGLDAAFGHKIAEATMNYLLDGLAAGIMAREHMQEWQPFEKESHMDEQRQIRVVKGTCIVEPAMLPPG